MLKFSDQLKPKEDTSKPNSCWLSFNINMISARKSYSAEATLKSRTDLDPSIPFWPRLFDAFFTSRHLMDFVFDLIHSSTIDLTC